MDETSFDARLQRAVASYGAEYVRAREAFLAGARGEEAAAVNALEQRVTSAPTWEARLTADILRGWLEDRAVYEQMVEYLREPLPGPRPLTGYTPPVRGQAIASLGRAVVPRALEMLWKSREAANEKEMGALFAALMRLKDRRALEPLLALLGEPGARAAHFGALQGLSALGDARALDAVIRKTAETQPEARLRAAALASLAGYADRRATDTLLDALLSPNRTREERKSAAQALYKRGDPAAREAVLSRLPQERETEVLHPLILLMGRIGQARDTAVLEGLRANADAVTREAIADAIEEIRSRQQQEGREAP